MKRFLLTIMAIVFLLSALSCSQVQEPAGNKPESVQAAYIKISAAEAREMIVSKEVIILDVRTPEEFLEARIEGALLIPDYDLEKLAEEMLPDKDATILVYCRTGRRSEIASKLLLDLGYQYVYDFGGIVDWNYETVTGELSQQN